MVGKERVIEFPVPDWNVPFSTIPENAFCICYQSDVDGNGYGPYGFNTELAIALIAKRFKSVYRYSEENFQILPVENITAKGFYFFEISKALEFELSEYARNLKKIDLATRYGKALDIQPVKPKILEYFSSGKLDVERVNEEFLEKIFVRNNYAPQAGETLIFFSKNERARIMEYCKELGISYCVAKSIDDMKSW